MQFPLTPAACSLKPQLKKETFFVTIHQKFYTFLNVRHLVKIVIFFPSTPKTFNILFSFKFFMTVSNTFSTLVYMFFINN